MCRSLFSVDIPLHKAVLIDTDCCEKIKSTFIARINTIKDHTHYNLLPCWAAFVPEFGLLQVDNVANILHDSVQGTSSQYLVFIVSGDRNKKLRVSIIHGWTQIVAIFEGEVIGIAVGSSV